ncbi:MAG: PH domain-containing protein [Clostridiaceae bacterium]
MIDKPNRNHWIIIIQDIFNILKQLLFFIIIMVTVNIKYLIIGSAIFLISAVAVSIVRWLNTEYYIKDNILIYKTGIFERSKQEIPFDKINTIDINKNLIDRIFGVCTVKVDSGSTALKKSEFNIKVQYEIAEKLRDKILDAKNDNMDHKVFEEHKNEEPIKKVITIKEIVIYAITKSKLAWSIGGYFAVMNFADDLEIFTKTSVVNNLMDSININKSFLEDKIKLIGIIIGLILFIYIIVTLLSIVFEIVKFYNFTIQVKDKSFNISYGLLSKKEYSIPIEKIHALKYKQGILQQLLGVYMLEVITIGYGDEVNEKAILYPIANNKVKEEILAKILPEMIYSGQVKTPPKSSIKRFVFIRVLIPLIILIPMYFFIKDIPSVFKLAAISIVTLIGILLGYLNYKNTSLGITKKIIITTCGGLTKTTTLIKQSSVQSIEKIQNPFQRTDKVCDYKIDIYSNKLAEAVKVRHMTENLDHNLYENLIM